MILKLRYRSDSEEERDEWVSAIRTAKASLLISLNAMHPNSTLTASSSNAHIRRTLQALPHLPEEETSGKKPRRGKVEHFVPPIWIPDAKTSSCMRCSRTFGWRRRRHHCRLCGRCVCSACSTKVNECPLRGTMLFIIELQTFYISDTSKKASNKPARACDTCYDSVFPLIDDGAPLHTPSIEHMPPTDSQFSHMTMSGFPSWQSISMPALGMPGLAGRQASALLGVDLGNAGPSRHVSEVDDSPIREGSKTPPRFRIKPPSRPRSYVQILEDFQAHEAQPATSVGTSMSGLAASAVISRGYSQQSGVTDGSTSDLRSTSDPEMEGDINPSMTALSETDFATSDEFIAGTSPPISSSFHESMSHPGFGGMPVTPKRKEDTVRRHKRFSMPAMALQTTPVTTKASGDGKGKRFSLVLGRGEHSPQGGAHAGSPNQANGGSKRGLGNGPAATKLNELLGRKKL